jgi:hypothetical protein
VSVADPQEVVVSKKKKVRNKKKKKKKKGKAHKTKDTEPLRYTSCQMLISR